MTEGRLFEPEHRCPCCGMWFVAGTRTHFITNLEERGAPKSVVRRWKELLKGLLGDEPPVPGD